MSTREVWMWGEVYARARPIQRLVDVFRAFDDEFPDSGLYLEEGVTAEKAAREWIARLSPEPPYLMSAHRAFWDRLCAVPAEERGYERWGLKAVSLSVDHAIYLRRLYPDARIVFLIRNPYRAWLSYRRFQNWYATFPDDPVFTVQRFSRLWAENTRDYLAYASETDTLLIRFEDLIEDRAILSELETYIGCPVDESVLGHRVSGTDRRPDRKTTIVERLAIGRITGSVAEALRYESA